MNHRPMQAILLIAGITALVLILVTRIDDSVHNEKGDAQVSSPTEPSFHQSGALELHSGSWIYQSQYPRPQDIVRENATATIKEQFQFTSNWWFYHSILLQANETKVSFQIIYATKDAPTRRFFDESSVELSWVDEHIKLDSR